MMTEKGANALVIFVILLFIAVLTLALSGCTTMVTEYEDGKKTRKVPASVVFMEASAEAHGECDEQALVLTIDEIAKLSASAQAEYIRNVPMLLLLNQMGNKGGCHSQIASETKAYFVSQTAKYNQYGAVGRAGVIGGFTYLGFRSLFGMMESASSAGDISIGSINATKSDDPISGEGGSSGHIGGQVINVGGTTVTDRGSYAENVDKNMNTQFHDSDSNLDGSGSPSGIQLNDEADGANNDASFF